MLAHVLVDEKRRIDRGMTKGDVQLRPKIADNFVG